MFQTIYNAGDDDINVPIIHSTDDLTRIPDSHILQQEDENNALKKVMSLDCSKIETKHKYKFDYKAYKVKNTVYTTMQRNFINAAVSLKNSYETLKKIQFDVLSVNNNDIEYDELNTIVKDIIEKQFGIKFLNDLFKRDHQNYTTNLNLPQRLDISYTSGHQKLDLAIKEPYEAVWKYILDISETNLKYHFWLQKIIEPNEFSGLHDVKEYLMQNMINEEKIVEKVDSSLNYFYDNLQLKLINVINEALEVLQCNECTTEKQINVIKNKNDEEVKNAESNAIQTIIDDYKRQMELKIKTMGMENDKLKRTELDYSKQIQSLLGELTFQNRKLTNTKERLMLLTKEKNDLIAMVKKMEVKEEGFLSLQDKCEKEQEKNRQLRSIISKKYEVKRDIRFYH